RGRRRGRGRHQTRAAVCGRGGQSGADHPQARSGSGARGLRPGGWRVTAPHSRPLRVLHVTAVERSNYYLNNLARFLPRERVEILGVTLGRDLSFVEGLASVGAAAGALE